MHRTRHVALPQGAAWLAISVTGCLLLPQLASAGIYCHQSNQAIPDGSEIQDELIVTDHLAITDLNVKILASHTWVGDLVFILHQDEGDGHLYSQPLMDRPLWPDFDDGCGLDDVDLILDDESENGAIENQCETPLGANGPYTPAAPLALFDGHDIAGTWRLAVIDSQEFDTGTLVEWCLINQSLLDVDGDGEVTPLTDGLLILRHRFGFTGSVLVAGAVDLVNCTRCAAADIETYLDELP